MVDEFDHAKNLYQWNKRVFAVMGVWPLESTYMTFAIWIVYLVFHMSTEFLDLFQVFGNFELMILNLSESTLELMIFAKLIVLRFSKRLVKLLNKIITEVDSKLFETPEEMKIYLNYNRIAKTYFRMWVSMGAVASIVYHIKPLEFRLRAAFGNDSVPFVMPYRGHLFLDVTESLLFWSVWIYQIPMIYINMFHSMTIGFLFSLILHICGQLAVLAHRVKNVKILHSDDHQGTIAIFKDIVGRHRNIINSAKDIEKVFHLVLLEELLISTLLVGLTTYSVLVNSDFEDKPMFFSFLLYGATMLWLIYGYCVAGEYLMTESAAVYDAFYQCPWYDVSTSFKKQMLICMINASKPLQLTGGGFYIFCSSSFTSVLKTAMSYISMLRTMI